MNFWLLRNSKTLLSIGLTSGSAAGFASGIISGTVSGIMLFFIFVVFFFAILWGLYYTRTRRIYEINDHIDFVFCSFLQ